MKKIGIILALLPIIIVGLWIFNEAKPKTAPSVKQTDEQGEVTVEVTPLLLQAGKDAKFEVVLDTHSVELSYNLMEAASLIDNQGKQYKPISWSGGSGGHHLSGELVFPSLSNKIKSAQLIIANISGFDRKFTWRLK